MLLIPQPCEDNSPSGGCGVTPEPDALQLTALGLVIMMAMIATRRLARS